MEDCLITLTISNQMSAEDYAKKVVEGKLHDPVLSFEIANGFRFIKVLLRLFG